MARMDPTAAPTTAARDELIAQVEFVEATLDSLEEGIVACDAGGTLVLFNQATRRFHGLPEAPLQPERWADHYDLYDADGTRPLSVDEIPLFRALSGEVVRDAGMVIAPNDGPIRRIRATGRQVRGRDGELLGAVVAMHDVTSRVDAEQAAAHERARADRQRDELMAGVSHDMQTPLAALVGLAQVVAADVEGLAAADRLDDVTVALQRQAQHLQALVGQFLDYTRLTTTAALELRRRANSIADLVRSVTEARAHTGRVQLDVRSEPVADVDTVRVERVVGNLVANALRYSTGPVVVTVWTDAGHAVVQVSDRGPGLGDDPDSLFVRFARGPSSVDTDGTGLGLYVSRAIAEAHGGTLDGVDAVDGGAVLTLRLPLGATDPPAQVLGEAPEQVTP